MKWQNLTQAMAGRAPELLKIEAEVGDSRGLYSMFNSGGVECETGEFLYGLIRLVKPERILETGTHKGVSAAYMAQALEDNNRGRITTIEFEPQHFADAERLFAALGLSDRVNQILTDSSSFIPHERVDVLFLDTEPQIRFDELVRFYEAVKPGGTVLIHDLHQHMNQVDNEEHGFGWPYGKIPPAMGKLVVDDKLRPVHFRTPRGLTMFYKPEKATHRWR